MSLATLDRPRTTLDTAPVWAPPASTDPPPARAAATAPVVTSVPALAPTPARRLTAVPADKEARGIALYIGLDEAKAAAAGVDLGLLVAEIKKLTAALAPDAETHTAVALAPRGAGGRDVDVVRLALRDPSAVAKHRHTDADDDLDDDRVDGVIVDLSRKRVTIDGETAPLTYLEFELLQFLVLRVGQTVTRDDIVAGLWAGSDESPGARTVDVHVRRLRSKLGAYEDIVRTVRGTGYRFDKHADVAVTHTSAPSPDRF